jgi:molybdate transport system substrate-binding protein
MHRFIKLLIFVSLIILSQVSVATEIKRQNNPTITILAASSLTNVLPKIADAWKAKTGMQATFSFESSSKLAQQIKLGAPADLFFSADQEWMDYLDKADRIENKTRTTLLSNRIVLIVSSDSTFIPKSSSDLNNALIKHLALAGETVPAGKFARAALTSEGQLEKIQTKIVNAANVRGALQWVALKEAEAGIVFQTDAIVQPKVKVAFVFKESTHPKIEYPIAVIKESKNAEAAKSFIEFCKGLEAKIIFENEGFIVTR